MIAKMINPKLILTGCRFLTFLFMEVIYISFSLCTDPGSETQYPSQVYFYYNAAMILSLYVSGTSELSVAKQRTIPMLYFSLILFMISRA